MSMTEQKKWEALLRGQILSATTAKFISYISLADQKAQALIILNSILIPITLNWVNESIYSVPASIAIFTALFSIMFSILAIYPKRGARRVAENRINYLHFGDIGRLKEDQFLENFKHIVGDPGNLSEAVAKDLYDMGKNVMLPKFRWLKIAYISFFIGNSSALMWFFLFSYR